MHSVRDHRLKHLEDLAVFFQRWRESKKAGLTAQTFRAAELMCRSIPAIATCLIEDHGFRDVRIDYLQSDVIERRFGRIRQMSGANFFIGLKK